MKQKKLLAMALAAATVLGAVGEIAPAVTANAATGEGVNMSSFTLTPASGEVNKAVKFTATPSNSNYEYSFAISPAEDETELQDYEDAYANSEYQTSNSFTWTPKYEGDYVVTLNVWDKAQDDYGWKEFSFTATNAVTPTVTPTTTPKPTVEPTVTPTTTPDPGKVTGEITAVKPVSPIKLEITWKSVPGATKYVLKKGTSANGPFSIVKSVTDGSTSYVDKTSQQSDAASLVDYYYTVTPVTAAGNGNASAPVKGNSSKYRPSQINLVSAERADATHNLIEWETPEAGVYLDGYILYSLNADGSIKSVIKSIPRVDKTRYRNSVKEDATTIYGIKAFVWINGKKVGGEMSNPVTATYHMSAAPANVSAVKAAGTQAKVSWNTVDGADGYKVFATTKLDNAQAGRGTGMTVVNGGNTTSATVDSLGATTYYFVKAYKVVDGKQMFTTASEYCTFTR